MGRGPRGRSERVGERDEDKRIDSEVGKERWEQWMCFIVGGDKAVASTGVTKREEGVSGRGVTRKDGEGLGRSEGLGPPRDAERVI